MNATTQRWSDLVDSIVVGSVPAGDDHSEVEDWVTAQRPFRDGAITPTWVTRTLNECSWNHLTETTRFWGEDPSILHRATASILSGLWHLRTPLALRASGGPGGRLTVNIGAFPAHTAAVTSTFRANLGDITLQSAAPLTQQRTVSGTLRASPTGHGNAGEFGLLDRLCALTGTRWTLDAVLIPVDADPLLHRVHALHDLTTVLAAHHNHQRQHDPLTTTSVEDHRVTRLLGQLTTEIDRTEQMISSGGHIVAVRVAAPSSDELAAAVGAATATTTGQINWQFVPEHVTAELIPVSLLGAEQTADLLCPPSSDVHGLPTRRFVDLDQHPEPIPSTGPTIHLGTTNRGAELRLPVAALTNHVLVTGASGSGKTSFVASLLMQIHQTGIPFLVIEPVKDEYRATPVTGLRTWRPGAPEPATPWVLNPLEVPDGVAVATHLDRIVALMRNSLGMPDPLPHLVELGLQFAYQHAGIDLGDIAGPGPNRPVWPTLQDLIDECLKLPAGLGYGAEIRGNLNAALTARLGGLLRGPRGALLNTDEPFPIEELMSEPTVVNLDHIGDDHARSFIVGVVLIRAAEWRSVHPSADVEHVIVIEEGHRLAPAVAQTAGDRADPVGETARMFTNLLTESRATGQSIVVVDQSPGRLTREAIVNTGTKVALRSNDRDDHAALGAALGLDPDDERIFSSLERHQALVSWDGMDGPIRATVPAQKLPYLHPTPHRSTAVKSVAEPPPVVQRAVAALIRCGPDDDARARRAVLHAINDAFPGIDSNQLRGVARDVIRRAVNDLGRRRRWDTATRAAAVHAALTDDHSTAHPRQLLTDGRHPHLSCHTVCPGGGCLTGELLAEEADRLLADANNTLTRMLADPEERHRRLRRRVLAVLPAAPTTLVQHAQRCLTVQTFDEWIDPDTVAQLVAATPPPSR